MSLTSAFRPFLPALIRWTGCRPNDGVHRAARPLSQLVLDSQPVNNVPFLLQDLQGHSSVLGCTHISAD